MKLTDFECRHLLASNDHGVLSTLHSERGVDAVPVVYALHEQHVGVPIDRVKPKVSTTLQRERNLTIDPRATLLIERWHHDDWSQLWWVRAELQWVATPSDEVVEALAAGLEDRFAQYAGRPFERVMVFAVQGVGGWSARGT